MQILSRADIRLKSGFVDPFKMIVQILSRPDIRLKSGFVDPFKMIVQLSSRLEITRNSRWNENFLETLRFKLSLSTDIKITFAKSISLLVTSIC